MILLDGPLSSSVDSDDSDDSDVDVNRPVSPCNVEFVGANVDTGKSSIRSKAKKKKVIFLTPAMHPHTWRGEMRVAAASW